VWNTTLTFSDLEHGDSLRVEVKDNCVLRENILLCWFEFTVKDIMGQDRIQNLAMVAEPGEKASGDITVSFDFDPPVPAAQLAAINEPIGADGRVTSQRMSTLLRMADPAYLNVDGNFSCLLLDSDLQPGSRYVSSSKATESSSGAGVNDVGDVGSSAETGKKRQKEEKEEVRGGHNNNNNNTPRGGVGQPSSDAPRSDSNEAHAAAQQAVVSSSNSTEDHGLSSVFDAQNEEQHTSDTDGGGGTV
jgi:hypothetical protein